MRGAFSGRKDPGRACPLGRAFAYHRLDSVGIRVELVDESPQAGFLGSGAPTTPAMPALELNPPASEDNDG
jgi:hypothetical protein